MSRLKYAAELGAAVALGAAISYIPAVANEARAVWSRRRIIRNALRGYPIAYMLEIVDGQLRSGDYGIISHCRFTGRSSQSQQVGTNYFTNTMTSTVDPTAYRIGYSPMPQKLKGEHEDPDE